MATKIYISPSNQESNLYATGGTNEKEQCHKIARACYDYLKKEEVQKLTLSVLTITICTSVLKKAILSALIST